MGKREMAKKMLEFFGANGEHWSNRPGVTNKCCLLEATQHVFGHGKDALMDDEISKRLGIPQDLAAPSIAIGRWNDRQTWPTIKRLLNSIKDGRKYTGPKAI